MGTYTTNYQLYMPTVGEQGWGEIVNGNITKIDTAMKGLDTRITAVENEVNGALSCTSVTTSGKVTANGGVGTTSLTTSGTITSTGKITANGGLAVTGGITSNLTGNVTGNLTGIITRTATLANSTPYTHANITVMTMPSFSFNDSTVRSLTLNIPSTVTTPWGNYSMTRGTFTVNYSVRANRSTSATPKIWFNDVLVFNSFIDHGETKTFTITVDLSKTNVIKYQSEYSYDNLANAWPTSNATYYLKCT